MPIETRRLLLAAELLLRARLAGQGADLVLRPSARPGRELVD